MWFELPAMQISIGRQWVFSVSNYVVKVWFICINLPQLTHWMIVSKCLYSCWKIMSPPHWMWIILRARLPQICGHSDAAFTLLCSPFLSTYIDKYNSLKYFLYIFRRYLTIVLSKWILFYNIIMPFSCFSLFHT